ncbi:hypothetical protein F2Q69_00049792 [Brassica cretica]|uniref:Uncharacterized protein n=1 Tax=Brassica cretica TaxID=69181 RepID=A0A8S9Q3Z5_BRACR|nr:hypothetical protein F2Q69_00049792 [Brassica cretica]
MVLSPVLGKGASRRIQYRRSCQPVRGASQSVRGGVLLPSAGSGIFVSPAVWFKRSPLLNRRRGLVSLAHCPQKKRQEVPVKRTRRGRSKDKQKWIVVDATVDIATKSQPQDQTGAFHQVQSEPPKSPPAASHSTRSKMELIAKSKLGTEKDKAVSPDHPSLRFSPTLQTLNLQILS